MTIAEKQANEKILRDAFRTMDPHQAQEIRDPIWEVLYPEEQSRILELLIETVRVSENNVDIRFRTNGIEKIVEELTSQKERSNG
ncbi:MAG: hypothetical protein ACK6AT_19040 [Planctomycetota bacterium]